MNNKKILYVNWGGLGDHLAFSTLPEIFAGLGFDFYISDKSSFRSQEIYDLIWGTNPYVKGITSENANCGHLSDWGVTDPVVFEKTISLHANIEKIYGVGGGSNYPKIYYKPKNISKYNDYILLDLNASSVANYSHNPDIISNYLKSLKGEKVLFVSPESSYGVPVFYVNSEDNFNFEPIVTENIFNYVDLIYSCKKFVCFWSGGAHVASTIKHYYKNNLDIDCLKVTNLGPEDWGNSDKSFFWYDNTNYILC